MRKIELIDKIVKRVIDYKDSEWAMNIHHWDWVPGVGMYGIYKAWKYTRNESYFTFIKGWVDMHVNEAYGVKTVNSSAPLLTVLGVYEETNDLKYLKVCTDVADWIINEAPRTRENGFEHTVTEAVAGFKEQIWADTLFMVCIFLARLGRITGQKSYSDEAADQLYIHHKLLKDTTNGLFYHGWNCESKNWMSAAHWGRANAWITVSTVEILEELPESFAGREEIINSLIGQVNGLSKVQRVNGMFGTLLDVRDSYDETSTSAGISAGIKKGIKKGYIPAQYGVISDKAEKAVIERVNIKGEVEGVSTGTPIMPTLEDYKKIGICPTLYGQALTLLMLCQ